MLANKGYGVTELYALPDHEVVGKLLPWIDMTPVSNDAAAARIHGCPGMVPIAIDHRGGGRIIWADFGDYPFREWQYIFTVQHLAETGAIQDAFVSHMDVLLNDALFARGIAPQGFIFHISRCGSTLLGKSLARVEENLVINQGAPLQRGFWTYLSDDWRKPLRSDAQAQQMFRNLILAMTRPRLGTYCRSFVKFISWNTLYIDFIMKAWPGVRSVFLFRDPVEVIASVKKATTAALVAKTTRQAGFLIGDSSVNTETLSDVAYLARCYAHYFEKVLEIMRDDLTIVEYRNVTSENLEIILRDALGYKANQEALAQMREQFKFHSKDDANEQKFNADSKAKQALMSDEESEMISGACGELMGRLQQSPRNLFSSTACPV